MAFSPINSVYNRFAGSDMGMAISEGRTARAFKSYFRSDVHRAGMSWVKDSVGMGSARGLGRLLGPGFLAIGAYSGYQNNGISGAMSSIGTDLAISYGIRAGLQAFGMPLLKIGLPMVGAAGMVAGLDMAIKGESPIEYFSKPYVNDYMKKRARLEMGAPINDPFGNTATMRQRSLNAIRNSNINGRAALGHEASLMYSSYNPGFGFRY